MAIYRTLYYGDVTVGVGGRITIPQEMRDDLRLEEGDTLTAVNGFRRCLAIREEFPRARINLVIQLYNFGEWEELMRVCTDGVRLEPQNPYYHYYFGLYYEKTGESELARNRFTYCLRQPIPDDMRKDIDAALERLAPGE